METKLFVFLLTISLCNGHVPFGDIISAAHSKIHKVAGGILDGLAHGLHLNVEGNVGVETKTSHQPNYGSRKPTDETIVVIVEEGADSKEYDRSPEYFRPHQNEHRPPFNNGVYGPGHNGYRPHQNGHVRPHHHGHENFNNEGNYNNFHHGGPNGRPQHYYDNNHYHGHNQHGHPNYPNEKYPNGGPQRPPGPNENNGFYDQNNGNNNNEYNNNPNPGNNYNNRPNRLPFDNTNQQNNNNIYPNSYHNNGNANDRPTTENNYNGIPNQSPPFNNNNQQNNNNVYPNPNYNNVNANTDDQFIKNPSTVIATKEPVSTLKPSEKPKAQDSDIPLFIPLLPNGNMENDKIVTAPKRETDDNKPKPAEEEDFELDIRIKE